MFYVLILNLLDFYLLRREFSFWLYSITNVYVNLNQQQITQNLMKQTS